MSVSISIQVENIYSDYKNSVDTNGLEKAKETFHLLDSTAQDILLKISSNPSTTLLSLAPSIDKVSPVFIRSFQRMQDMVLPFIHSINVVHVKTGKIISTNQGWTKVSGNLTQELESAYPDLPHLTPLPLETAISQDGIKELVFVYILRDALFKEEGLKHGVILLADVSWFLDALSQADDSRTGTAFKLYHPQYGILGKTGSVAQGTRISNNLINQLQEDSHRGEFRVSVESTPYMIDYQVLGDSNLYLLRLRDETILKNEILALRVKTAGIYTVFLIVIILGSVFINRKIYQPFNSVASEIRTAVGDKLSLPESDLDLLNALYATLRDEYSEVGEDRIVNSCLRALTQEELRTPEETIGILEKRGIQLSADYPGRLVLLSLDEADDEFNVQNSVEFSSYLAMKYQLKQALKRFAGELDLISNSFYLRKGVILALLYSKNHSPLSFDTCIDNLHSRINTQIEGSISLSASPPLNSLHNLRHVFLEVKTLLSYRFFVGRGSVLTEKCRNRIPEKEEEKEIRTLRGEIIKKFVGLKLEQADFRDYSRKLSRWAVEKAQDELNEFALDATKALAAIDPAFQGQVFFRSLINQPTLEDFILHVSRFAEENRGSVVQTDSRHSALITKAREIIEKSYQDPGLNINLVAETLKMSTPYFGMIFKKSVGIPFADYLTLVRVQEAANMLRTGRNSVHEIMFAVGIPSESTFYRRFRETFQVTPQIYRKQSVLNGS